MGQSCGSFSSAIDRYVYIYIYICVFVVGERFSCGTVSSIAESSERLGVVQRDAVNIDCFSSGARVAVRHMVRHASYGVEGCCRH